MPDIPSLMQQITLTGLSLSNEASDSNAPASSISIEVVLKTGFTITHKTEIYEDGKGHQQTAIRRTEEQAV